jgi:hypothetical protein
MRQLFCFLCFLSLSGFVFLQAQDFRLDTASGHFRNSEGDVMAFDDIYPEGHQSGVSIIMHGNRVATSGDIRFEPSPGQWQPVPVQRKRDLDGRANTIVTSLGFPDTSRHLTGFNPMIYPDFVFNYTVNIRADGASVIVTVDLDRPVPDEWLGKVGFNLELFPGALFGKPWIMDGRQGIFPQQPNGPTLSQPAGYLRTGDFVSSPGADREHLAGHGHGYSPSIADDVITEPYAVGRSFTVRPDEPHSRLTIRTEGADLKLYDGRMNHNNGWFVVRSEATAGATREAVKWIITPNAVDGWRYEPVIQISQVGYHPGQSKVAVIELDGRDPARDRPVLYRITERGEQAVHSAPGQE